MGSAEHFLTRVDGKRDLVIFVFPTCVDRVRIQSAYRTAVGFREGLEEPDTQLFDPEDVAAVCWAAVGLCWQGPKIPDMPSFRGCGRDVIAYGEQVSSALYLAGYPNPEELVKVGRELYQAFMKDMAEATVKAAGDFPEAPAPN